MADIGKSEGPVLPGVPLWLEECAVVLAARRGLSFPAHVRHIAAAFELNRDSYGPRITILASKERAFVYRSGEAADKAVSEWGSAVPFANARVVDGLFFGSGAERQDWYNACNTVDDDGPSTLRDDYIRMKVKLQSEPAGPKCGGLQIREALSPVFKWHNN
jgi:hypothetical protein